MTTVSNSFESLLSSLEPVITQSERWVKGITVSGCVLSKKQFELIDDGCDGDELPSFAEHNICDILTRQRGSIFLIDPSKFSTATADESAITNDECDETNNDSERTNDESDITNNESGITNHSAENTTNSSEITKETAVIKKNDYSGCYRYIQRCGYRSGMKLILR